MTRVRRTKLAVVALFACLLLAPAPGNAAKTAFRINSLALRDPHVFKSVIGCNDLTTTGLAGYSINNQIQTALTTDSDSDGLLDLNELIVFDPLDPSAPTGSLQLVAADCTAPAAGTQCQFGAGSVVGFAYQNLSTGACLAPIPGTTFAYSPAITTPVNNCFATGTGTVTIELGGLPLILRDARLGGVYNGPPVTSIVNGLLMGFETEADANATTLPAALPLIGGQSLASVLAGGTGNCASHSDKDLNGGVQGWWFYFNFTATQVPYNDGTTAVDPDILPNARIGEARPNPFRGTVSLEYSLPVASAVRAWVTDLAGRRVASLANGIQILGAHSIVWDGRDETGAREPAGVYFIRVEAMGRISTRRVALLR